ncbi:MAG: hypothetical protein MHPSP_004862, partial [Paramarteilia canceri]
MKAAFKKTNEKLFEGGEIDFDKSPYCKLKGSFNYAESEVPKRLHCIDHALSNNLKAGIKKTEAIGIAKKIKYNGVSSQILFETSGKAIVLPSSTCWNYLKQFFERFLELKLYVKNICEQHLEIDFLTIGEIESANFLLKIFQRI